MSHARLPAAALELRLLVLIDKLSTVLECLEKGYAKGKDAVLTLYLRWSMWRRLFKNYQ